MNKSEELIACLEGEIAKRDARIVELEYNYQDCNANKEAFANNAISLQESNTKLRAELARVTRADAHYQAEALRLAAELAAIKAQKPVGFRVKTQGIQFGKAWYSHESITGSAAESLNDGTCGLTARQYMDWVRSALAAPVSEAKAQGVVMPRDIEKSFLEWASAQLNAPTQLAAYMAGSDEVARLSAAPVPVQPKPCTDCSGLGFGAFGCCGECYGSGHKLAAPAAPAADAWIPVSERLPGEDDQVLCWCEDETVAWAEVSSHHNSFFTDMTHELLPVTHWMPLPAAPAAHRAKGVV